ncbi:unnamed protein product [Symbiodinium microadriaticum]|nr:unnamed protein product [Symbiodinium microadriaticum]
MLHFHQLLFVCGAEKTNLAPGFIARTAMFSVRFNRKNKHTELKFRAVCELLRARDLKILMVEAGAGDDFGRLTARSLRQLKDENGLMLAVCTSDYAEMTASPYSSYAELVFAIDNHVDILPLRVEETYPPQPPWGENHPFDKHGDAKGFVSMAMKSSVVFLDCRDKPEEQIADEIEAKLRITSHKKGIEASPPKKADYPIRQPPQVS